MIEIVADLGDKCGECPVWDEQTSTLYWTDNSGARFYRYNPANGEAKIVLEGFDVCCFRLNQPGGFILGNNQGLWLWDGSGVPALLAAEVDGQLLRLNDGAADPAGRFWVGSQFYDPQGSYPLGKLFAVQTDGSVEVKDEGFHLSNGIGFSPDATTLYMTDSIARRIYAYSYNQATGAIRDRRVLVQVSSTEGLPDGLAVDAEGFLWSAHWYGSCVVRYDPDGNVERRIAVPAKQTSCAAFGGSDLRDLFITSASLSEPMPEMPPGYDAENGLFGGPLYRVRTDVRGLPALRANIAKAGTGLLQANRPGA